MKRVITACVVLLFLTNLNCKKEEKDLEVPLKGLINFINGNVKVYDINGKGKKANIGDEIVEGMKIETIGKKSFAEIFFDENVVKILGNSIVEVKRLIEYAKAGTREVKFLVGKGQLFSRVKKKLVKGDLYEVLTPTATAGVRGTEFLVEEKDGKANVACLSGLVSVLNNSMAEAEPVVLEKKEETDVVSGQDMVKKQISGDRLRMLNIISEIKEMRQEIRRKFEKQREEIRKHVKDQKEKNKAMLNEQIEKDKALVEDQKRRDRENIEEIKGKTNEVGKKALDEAKQKMDDVKVDKDAAKKLADDAKNSVKPKIEKLKIDKKQFKKKE